MKHAYIINYWLDVFPAFSSNIGGKKMLGKTLACESLLCETQFCETLWTVRKESLVNKQEHSYATIIADTLY